MTPRCAGKSALRPMLLLAALAAAAPLFGQVVRPPRVPPITQPTRPAEPGFMRMRVEGQELTAQIQNMPLQRILDDLAARTGVVFEIESQENPATSITLYRAPLEEAIRRIIGTNDSIAYYEKDESGQSRVRFVRVLSRNIRQTPPSLRYLGTGAITKRGDDLVETPEQALTALMENPDLMARQKAIEVLVSSKSDAAIPALRVALADPSVEVRVAAIEGLAALSAREALRQIIAALKDIHPGVRQSAALAVSNLGDAGNVKDLRPLLHDIDGSVAAAADLAIRKLTGKHP